MKIFGAVHIFTTCLLLTCSKYAMAFNAELGRAATVAGTRMSETPILAMSNDNIVDSSKVSTRRNFLSNAMLVSSSSVATSALIGFASPAHADVADGTELPKGVAQFGRIVRAKVELLVSIKNKMRSPVGIVDFLVHSVQFVATHMVKLTKFIPLFLDFGYRLSTNFIQYQQKVQKRVSTKSDEFEQQDWDSLGQFLRKIYAIGDDMKFLANTMNADKKAKADELIDNLRKYSKAADAPAANKNAKEFVAYTQQLIVILEKYFDLLTDVPDEI